MKKVTVRLTGNLEAHFMELRKFNATDSSTMRIIVYRDYLRDRTSAVPNTIASDPYRKPTFLERLLNWRKA